MADLTDIARDRGVTEMEGIVLAANHKMLKFARQSGSMPDPQIPRRIAEPGRNNGDRSPRW